VVQKRLTLSEVFDQDVHFHLNAILQGKIAGIGGQEQ
jgi:hypothetical protein